MSAAAEWKPKLRWLMRRILLLRPSRRPLERPRRMAARMPSRWARRVRASLTNGASRERAAQASQASRCAGARRRVVEVVEQPELLAQQEGAVEAGVGLLDLAEGGRAGRGSGARAPSSSDQRVPLTQRPVAVCERSWAFHSSRRTWSVARLARRQTWNGSKQISACGIAGADRALILAAHVDRDRPDRAPALAELVEEGLQGGAVAARRAPHDRARGVVGDAGQVALAAAIGDLVDADRDEADEAPRRRGGRP